MFLAFGLKITNNGTKEKEQWEDHWNWNEFTIKSYEFRRASSRLQEIEAMLVDWAVVSEQMLFAGLDKVCREGSGGIFDDDKSSKLIVDSTQAVTFWIGCDSLSGVLSILPMVTSELIFNKSPRI